MGNRDRESSSCRSLERARTKLDGHDQSRWQRAGLSLRARLRVSINTLQRGRRRSARRSRGRRRCTPEIGLPLAALPQSRRVGADSLPRPSHGSKRLLQIRCNENAGTELAAKVSFHPISTLRAPWAFAQAAAFRHAERRNLFMISKNRAHRRMRRRRCPAGARPSPTGRRPGAAGFLRRAETADERRPAARDRTDRAAR